MIQFNNPEFCIQRIESKPLPLDAARYAVSVINDALSGAVDISDDELALVQQFVWEYENLKHFKDSHCTNYVKSLEVNYDIVKSKQ